MVDITKEFNYGVSIQLHPSLEGHRANLHNNIDLTNIHEVYYEIAEMVKTVQT